MRPIKGDKRDTEKGSKYYLGSRYVDAMIQSRLYRPWIDA